MQRPCQVVPPAIQAKELEVQHVRNPGERDPVAAVARGQSPLQPLRSDPLPDVQVAGEIDIVVVHEIEVADLGVDREIARSSAR